MDRINYAGHFKRARKEWLTQSGNQMDNMPGNNANPEAIASGGHKIHKDNQAASDSISSNWFNCTLCNKMEIKENNLVKHHKSFHSYIPFRKDIFSFEKTMQVKYICYICQNLHNASDRRNHHQEYHPEFIHFKDLFDMMHVTIYPRNDEGEKPSNEGHHMVKCKHCKTNVLSNNYVEHFQRKHPKCLKEISNIKMERNVGMQNEMDVKGNDAKLKEVNVTANAIASEATTNDEIDATDSHEAHDVKKINYFKCKMCDEMKNMEIELANLVKHHKKFHKDLPFQRNKFILVKTIEIQYQCNVCQGLVSRCDKQNHHQTNHAVFKYCRDLYEVVKLTQYADNGKATWCHNKDSATIPCKRCTNAIYRNNFVRHFQRQHPDCMNLDDLKLENKHNDEIYRTDRNSSEGMTSHNQVSTEEEKNVSQTGRVKCIGSHLN